MALSCGIFFLITLPRFANKPEPGSGGEAATPPVGEVAPRPVPDPPPPANVVGEPGESVDPVDGDPQEPTEDGRPAPLEDPQEFLAELFRKVVAGEDPAADQEIAALLQSLLRDGGFEIAGEDSIVPLGKIGGNHRFAIAVESGDARSRITIDLKKSKSGGWEVVTARIPEVLESYLAEQGSLAPPPPTETVGQPMPVGTRAAGDEVAPAPAAQNSAAKLLLIDPVPGPEADVLDVASGFLDAVLAKDFVLARRFIDRDRITEERLAALFIVVEDGGYQRSREGNALLTTAARDRSAWVIARLVAPAGGPAPEFGIEFSKSEPAGQVPPWKVVQLNFSQVIAEVAASLGAGDIGYAPIVADPEGGESLALYFPFDESEIHPRAARQLAIVAEILIADGTKTITIDGHADGKGSENYNEGLSSRRAANVSRELLRLGVPDKQVITRAFGKRNPIEPNVNPDGSDNPAGRSRNRRAEVVLDF